MSTALDHAHSRVPSIDDAVADATELARQEHARRTREEYARDWRAFCRYAQSRGEAPVPARPEFVALWVRDHARGLDVDPPTKPRAPGTIARRLAAIAHYHRLAGVARAAIPTEDARVLAVLNGYRSEWARTRAIGPRKAEPLLWDQLPELLSTLDEQKKSLRDRALVLLGFATALRGTNLATLTVEEVRFVSRGLLVTPRVTKTNPHGKEEPIPVPIHPDVHRDAVAALASWLQNSGIVAGPIFRSFTRYGELTGHPLCRRDVSRILARICARAGVGGKISSHSLRRGFLTSAHLAGAPRHTLKHVSKHRSEDVLSGYIEDADLLRDPALLYLR
jgi:integrase